jgi:hypothetical protein
MIHMHDTNQLHKPVNSSFLVPLSTFANPKRPAKALDEHPENATPAFQGSHPCANPTEAAGAPTPRLSLSYVPETATAEL